MASMDHNMFSQFPQFNNCLHEESGVFPTASVSLRETRIAVVNHDLFFILQVVNIRIQIDIMIKHLHKGIALSMESRI